MAAPPGYVDRRHAEKFTGLHRNTINKLAREGKIPGAIQRAPHAPWYFTEAGLRQLLGIEDAA